MKKRSKVLAVAALLGLVAGACGGDSGGAQSGEESGGRSATMDGVKDGGTLYVLTYQEGASTLTRSACTPEPSWVRGAPRSPVR